MEKLGVFLAAIGLVALISILLAWPTMILWNTCLVPAVDGVHPVSFWQALGLNFLFSILFKSSTSSSKKD